MSGNLSSPSEGSHTYAPVFYLIRQGSDYDSSDEAATQSKARV